MVNPVYGDRVQETFTTTGTGTISLAGAVVGYQAFSAIVANLGTCYYAATDGTNWEVGLGTYTTSGDTLTRTTILASSNSGSAVNWAAGTKNIWLDFPAAAVNAGPLAGFRNFIINGDFRVAQRGTTYTLTSSLAYGSVDRWAATGVNAAGIANQDTSITAGLGFKNNIKLGRNAASSALTQTGIFQALESINSIPLAGQQVTLSFWAKAGANFSASGSGLVASLVSGTGTDQSAVSGFGGGWTGQATVAGSTATITTTWTRYSYTGTVASSATQLGVSFSYTPTGTAGADDNVYITGVQLEQGSIATPFENRPFQTELSLCETYYEKSFAYATAPVQNIGSFLGETNGIAGKVATTTQYLPVPFRVRKRTAPSITLYNPNAANAQVRDETAGVDCSATTTFGIGEESFTVTCTGNASTAIGNIIGINWAASSEL